MTHLFLFVHSYLIVTWPNFVWSLEKTLDRLNDVTGTALLSVPAQHCTKTDNSYQLWSCFLGHYDWHDSCEQRCRLLLSLEDLFPQNQPKWLGKEGISFLIPQPLSCCLGHLPIAKGWLPDDGSPLCCVAISAHPGKASSSETVRGDLVSLQELSHHQSVGTIVP